MRIYIKIGYYSGHSIQEIYSDLKLVYKDDAYSIDTIYKWIRKFKEKNFDTSKCSEKIQKEYIETNEISILIDDNPSLSLRQISNQIKCSKNHTYYLMSQIM